MEATKKKEKSLIAVNLTKCEFSPTANQLGSAFPSLLCRILCSHLEVFGTGFVEKHLCGRSDINIKYCKICSAEYFENSFGMLFSSS